MNTEPSTSAAPSPSLSPFENSAMTSSIISNLELGQGQSTSPHLSSGQEHISSSGSGPQAASQDQTSTGIPRSSTLGAGQSFGQGATPLAPRDVLAQRPFMHEETTTTAAASSTNDADKSEMEEPQRSEASTSSVGIAPGNGGLADDSALDALVEAHKRDESLPMSGSSTPLRNRESSATGRSPSTKPDRRDASFGLDPDADTIHSVTGRPFRPLGGMLRSNSNSSHHQHGHGHHHHHQRDHSQDRSPYDQPEEKAPSHTTAATGAPSTMETASDLPDPIPSVSATGMPRILPRRTSGSPSRNKSPGPPDSADAPAPFEMQPPAADVDAGKTPAYAPSGSLTLAAFSPGPMSWTRRLSLVTASLAINLGLPFLNGVMLGFGEIFARAVLAPWIGLAPAAVNINAPGAPAGRGGAAKDVTAASFSPSNVGPRFGPRSSASVAAEVAGSGKGVDVESWQVESKSSRRRTEL